MTTVSIDADIKAKWPQGHSSHSPGSPEELAIIAIDLLVKELGTRAAQKFIEPGFQRYPTEQIEHEHAERNSTRRLAPAGRYLLQTSKALGQQIEEALGIAIFDPEHVLLLP